MNFYGIKKPDKIKREIIVQKLEDGGLNMPDVKKFIQSSKNIVDTKISPKQCYLKIDTHTRFASF